MLAIAVLAGLFAAFGVIGAIELVVVLGGPFLPILFAAPGRRLRVAVWVSSLYPFLILASFYATWLTAWWILGHRPRPSFDDPKLIGSVVIAVGSAPVPVFGPSPGCPRWSSWRAARPSAARPRHRPL